MTARSIVTLANLKLYLGTSANTSLDTTLEAWVDMVSGIIEEYCQRKFQPIQITGEILNGSGYWIQELNFSPIVPSSIGALSDIQYRDTDGLWSWANLLDSMDYIYVDDALRLNIELLGGFTFPEGRRNIKVNYIAGYSVMPAAIEKVCMEMVQLMWDESKAQGDRLGKLTESPGTMPVTYTDIHPRFKPILDKYRRFV